MTEYRAVRSAKIPPLHPGETLRDEILPALKMSVTGAARALGVSRQTLHNILAEKAGVTPEMALRIGKLCGNGPTLWLNLQQFYDLWHAERKLKHELAKIETKRAA